MLQGSQDLAVFPRPLPAVLFSLKAPCAGPAGDRGPTGEQTWLPGSLECNPVPPKILFYFFSITFFFGRTRGMWKFPGQGPNLCCGCSLRHGCGNTGSLTRCTARESPPIPIRPKGQGRQ